MIIQQQDYRVIDLNTQDTMWIEKSTIDNRFCITWQRKYSDYSNQCKFSTEEERDKVFDLVKKKFIKYKSQQFQEKEDFNLMKTLKSYFNKHQETIITLGVIWLADYFLFNGRFQDKIKNMIDKLLGNVEKKLIEESDKGPLK